MKSRILRKLMLIVVLLTSLHAFAYDFEVGGIYYNITSETDLTVEVTSGSKNYSGSIEIPNIVTNEDITYNVTTISSRAFKNCVSLTSVTIPNSITTVGGSAFLGCSGLTSIIIPNSVTTIYDMAFQNCSGLISVILPSSITKIKYGTFINCCSLTSITIPNSVTSIDQAAFKNCSSLTSITIPNSVTSIGNYAFYGCSSFTSISIPSSITSIGLRPFSNCNGLTSIIVEQGNTIYDSRDNCNAIIETSANMLIQGCKSTIIPNSVTSIGNESFYECNLPFPITIPNNVNWIGDYAFCYCGNISIECNATIPPTCSKYTFTGCTQVSLKVPFETTFAYKSATGWNDFIHYVSTEIEGIYYLTTSEKEVTVTYKDQNYNSYSGDVVIPSEIIVNDKTYKVSSIDNYAFSSCHDLTSVTIPCTISTILDYAFKNCSSIRKVESMNQTAPTMTETVFDSQVYENAQLVIPPKALASYQNATGWSKFANTKAGYNVEVDYSSTGGSVAVNNALQNPIVVDIASKVDFLITPKTGFEIEMVTLNEVDITEDVIDGKYTIERISEDVKFVVTFKKLYNIATEFDSENGSVTINGSDENPVLVSFDSKVDFEITPNEGYEIDKVTLNEVDVTADVIDGKYSIEKASEDVTLKVTFKKLLVITSDFNSEEGNVTINEAEVTSMYASVGSKLEIVITPKEGYELDKVIINENDVTADIVDSKYTIEEATEDVTITVTFKKLLVITSDFTSTEGNVTINEAEETSILVSSGSKVEFTITPNEEYKIAEVIVNGTDVTADIVDSKYTIEEATEDITITVTFKVKTFSLILKCSEAGAFKRIMQYGETATYEIVPSEMWEINTVVFNGVEVTFDLEDGVYTTPEITQDSELSVVFVDVPTSVYSLYDTSDVKVYASRQIISIKGLQENTPVAVYNASGQMEYNNVSTDYEMNINMAKNGVYLVKVGERTFKVIL